MVYDAERVIKKDLPFVRFICAVAVEESMVPSSGAEVTVVGSPFMEGDTFTVMVVPSGMFLAVTVTGIGF